MGSEREMLKLGKGAVFVKSQLRRLRQEDETWEADFRALPKPLGQRETHYVGMVLSQPDGFLLAQSEVNRSPTVNDLAALLAHAMKRPMVEGPHRPTRILFRGNRKWQTLFPALKEIGIEVVVADELPIIVKAFDEFVAHMKKARLKGAIRATKEQSQVETIFPAIAQWVRAYGYIEIGDQEGFGFIARALDQGGLIFEDEQPRTLAESMAALEARLAQWFAEEEVD